MKKEEFVRIIKELHKEHEKEVYSSCYSGYVDLFIRKFGINQNNISDEEAVKLAFVMGIMSVGIGIKNPFVDLMINNN